MIKQPGRQCQYDHRSYAAKLVRVKRMVEPWVVEGRLDLVPTVKEISDLMNWRPHRTRLRLAELYPDLYLEVWATNEELASYGLSARE